MLPAAIPPPGAHLDGPVVVMHRDAQAAGQAAQVSCGLAAVRVLRCVIIKQQKVAAGLEKAAAGPCRRLQPAHQGGACRAQHRAVNSERATWLKVQSDGESTQQWLQTAHTGTPGAVPACPQPTQTPACCSSCPKGSVNCRAPCRCTRSPANTLAAARPPGAAGGSHRCCERMGSCFLAAAQASTQAGLTTGRPVIAAYRYLGVRERRSVTTAVICGCSASWRAPADCRRPPGACRSRRGGTCRGEVVSGSGSAAGNARDGQAPT